MNKSLEVKKKKIVTIFYLNEKDNNQKTKCNFKKNEECPLNDNWLIHNDIYKATVKKEYDNNDNDECYKIKLKK